MGDFSVDTPMYAPEITSYQDWFASGASAPPPDSQPSFNSPVTQDSYKIFDDIATGVNAASKSLLQIFNTVSTVQTATSNNRTQATQLATQSQSQTQIQGAQARAQISTATANANIASAFAQLTANPLLLALLALLAIGLYIVAKKLL